MSNKKGGCLKWLGILLGVFILLMLVGYFMLNEPLPKGEKGPAADALAQKMLTAVDKPAWDSTRYVQWTFKGMHSFLWDKEKHNVEIKWGENKVLLNTKSVTGLAYENGTQLSGEAADKMVYEAWGYFCNDSFWLNAPVKAFDIGTERSIVKMEDGKEALMVSYTGGGVTPGDSYLWILDENGRPTSYKMWVSIIPIGGVEFTWENWETLEGGALISALHKGLLELDMSNLKAGNDLQSMGLKGDLFDALEK